MFNWSIKEIIQKMAKRHYLKRISENCFSITEKCQMCDPGNTKNPKNKNEETGKYIESLNRMFKTAIMRSKLREKRE